MRYTQSNPAYADMKFLKDTPPADAHIPLPRLRKQQFVRIMNDIFVKYDK